MIYQTDADRQNLNTSYTTKSLKRYSHIRERSKNPNLYGRSYYILDYLPKEWTLEMSDDSNSQVLSDYLYENTIDADPRVSKVISDHFWDF